MKKYLYEINWKVRNNTSSQRYEIRFKNDLNSDKVLKKVTARGNMISFYADEQYDYVSVRYLNVLGQPVGAGSWLKLTTAYLN